MNIGILNEMVASSSKKAGHPALEDDEVSAKYISAPEMNLAKRIAYGEFVTTNASHLQSRIWHSYVCLFPLFFKIFLILRWLKCRSKLKGQTEMLVGLNTCLCIEAKLADYS
jgi:hypothetical protein